MTDSQPAPQPSHSSRFASDWAVRQSKLIASGSWLGNVAQTIPSYVQLQG
jgi:hypothetical protein